MAPRQSAFTWTRARAVSPAIGTYSAGESSPFSHAFGTGLLQQYVDRDPNPHSTDSNAAHAHTELVDSLVADGWEPTGLNGHEWWQYGFRRRVTNGSRAKSAYPRYRDSSAKLPRGEFIHCPVCGEESNQTIATGFEEILVCSRRCVERFRGDPERYRP